MALLHLANAKALNFEFTEDEKKNIALAFERVLRELNRRRALLAHSGQRQRPQSAPTRIPGSSAARRPRGPHRHHAACPGAIPGSAQEQCFIAVDELPEEDALALMRSHQPKCHFASQQEDDEARAIVRQLRGFTLAVETAAIYLGRHTTPDACRRFRERLSPDLLRESETAATDPAVAVRDPSAFAGRNPRLHHADPHAARDAPARHRVTLTGGPDCVAVVENRRKGPVS